jgi:hypothetical protein
MNASYCHVFTSKFSYDLRLTLCRSITRRGYSPSELLFSFLKRINSIKDGTTIVVALTYILVSMRVSFGHCRCTAASSFEFSRWCVLYFIHSAFIVYLIDRQTDGRGSARTDRVANLTHELYLLRWVEHEHLSVRTHRSLSGTKRNLVSRTYTLERND